jgi:hypothetical protein
MMTDHGNDKEKKSRMGEQGQNKQTNRQWILRLANHENPFVVLKVNAFTVCTVLG